MINFKNYINEEVKKGNISFLHPAKGVYKLTRHPENDVYHMHNKFGDLTHTFSGHMSPEEIRKELKTNHQMMLILSPNP